MKSRLMLVRVIIILNEAHLIITSAVDHDPVKAARDVRTSRVAKNERQRLQNHARAQTATSGRDERKKDIEKTLATTRISTASMGRFDKKLDGEKKLRGVKRKVSLGISHLISACDSLSVVRGYRNICRTRKTGITCRAVEVRW